MSKREVLLDGSSLSDASRVFEIPFGSEVTFVALGLQDDDYVYFEMVYAPNLLNSCDCPPINVTPPAITIRSVLKFDGKPVILNKNNPVAVINAPQGQPMRAIRHIADPEDLLNFRLTMQETATRLVSSHLLNIMDFDVEENEVVEGVEGKYE